MVSKYRFRRGEITSLDDEPPKTESGIPLNEEPIVIPRKGKKVPYNDENYDSDVQKMVSFKGVIRPITVMAKNRSGGMYKMRIINVYVKPNTEVDKQGNLLIDKKTGLPKPKEYTRYYDKQSYSVNKKDIAKGSNSDNYYPEKARWSKKRKVEETPKSETSETSHKTEDATYTVKSNIVDLHRKRTKMAILKRLKLKKIKKPQSKPKCRCIKKK